MFWHRRAAAFMRTHRSLRRREGHGKARQGTHGPAARLDRLAGNTQIQSLVLLTNISSLTSSDFDSIPNNLNVKSIQDSFEIN